MDHDLPLRPKGKANMVILDYYEDSNSENLDQQSKNDLNQLKKRKAQVMRRLRVDLRRHKSLVYNKRDHL